MHKLWGNGLWGNHVGISMEKTGESVHYCQFFGHFQDFCFTLKGI